MEIGEDITASHDGVEARRMKGERQSVEWIEGSVCISICQERNSAKSIEGL